MASFGMALVSSKRKDSDMFVKGIEDGAALAFRALGRATLYTVGGFTVFCIGVCGMLGVTNVSRFIENSTEKLGYLGYLRI